MKSTRSKILEAAAQVKCRCEADHMRLLDEAMDGTATAAEVDAAFEKLEAAEQKLHEAHMA